jgi:putative DNA primase/helicase
LYLLPVAESGERKSECDRRFTEALREWQAEQSELMKPDLAKSRAEQSAWEQEADAVRSRIKEARKKGQSTEEARAELERLEAEKPEPVRVPRVLLESETAENLAWTLARPDGWPSAGLLSSEAGVIFGGHAMRRDSIMQSLALLNKLWSGEAHRVGRRTSESFELIGARLTMGLAVQPETVQTFFEDSHGLARGTGFAARFLIAWPETTQGTRFYRDAPEGWPGLTAYKARLRRLLDTRLTISAAGELMPQLLDMETSAFAAWRQYHDGVERELRDGGELADLRDVASKAPENVARVAALLHLFEHSGPGGRVSAAHVAAAARIVTWHLLEARRFLGGMALPKNVANAVKLEAWLVTMCRERGTDSLTAREVMHRGPNPVRFKVDLLTALTELTEAGRARLESDRRTIRVRPELLTDRP